MADLDDGVGSDDDIGAHGVQDLEHGEDLAVLSDPGGEPLGIQDDGFDVFVHAALAGPSASAAVPKSLERA